MSSQSPTNYSHDSSAGMNPRIAPTVPDQSLGGISVGAAAEKLPLRSTPQLGRPEAELVIQNLKDQVDDWKGLSIDTFRNLLLHDTLVISRDNHSHPYRAYLFERIFLCFKVKAKSRRLSKTLDLDRRSQRLRLIGRVSVDSIVHLTSPSTERQIQVFFDTGPQIETIIIHFDDQDNTAVWYNHLNSNNVLP